QSINPYFSVAKYAAQKIDPYSFSITANIIDHPGLRALIPGLTQFEPVVISANFSSTQGMNGIVDAPLIVMNGNRIEQLKMNAITVNNTIELNTSVTKLKTAGLNIYATTVAAKIANNNINFDLNIKDRLSNNRYTLTGLLAQPVNQQYSLSILPSNLMLNYQPWSINNGNRIDIRDGGVIANQFVLNHGSEQLSINSTQPVINSPLSIDFNNFKISTITGFIESDSILVNGNINGNVLIKNIQTQPSFTSGLTINDLSFNKDTLGDVKANVSNISPNIFATDITLTGRGNDLSIKGTYYLKPANQSSVDIDININALQLHTIEGLTMNSITEATGALN
ncbi:MAG: hypothetical protein ABIQ56_05620, partial [Chitinophagaceae bacterium]